MLYVSPGNSGFLVINREETFPIGCEGIVQSDRTRHANRLGKLGGWTSVGLNLFLFVLKGGLGLVSGSIALIADAFHSLSDMVTSFVVLISFHISGKPSDEEHPFGHERAEFISAIIMSTLLAVTAVELGRSSILRILHPAPFRAPWWIIGVLGFTVLLKELLAFFSHYLSRKIHSVTLKADSWHHHMDAISTVLVILSFVLVHFRLPNLDGWVGLVIALIILYTAIELAKNPIDELLGSAPDAQLLEQIQSLALSVPEVKGVHDIIVHRYGETLIISLDIEVDRNLSLIQAHDVADQVQKRLSESLNAFVTVHYDPAMEQTPFNQKVEEKLRLFCREHQLCRSYHDLQIAEKGKTRILSFDLVTDRQISVDDSRKLVQDCRAFLQKHLPELNKIEIHIEPSFTVSPEKSSRKTG